MSKDSQRSVSVCRRLRAIPWTGLWSVGILLLAALFAWRSRGVIAQAVPYLRTADYRVLAIVGLAEVGFLFLLGYANQWLYRMHGRRPPVRHLAAMVCSATMINEVLPSSGLSGGAGFVFWGNRLSFGLRDSIAVVAWFNALGYVSLIPLIAACVASLSFLHQTAAHLVAATLWTALAYATAAAFLGLWSWRRFERSDASAAQTAETKESTGQIAADPTRAHPSRHHVGATMRRLRTEIPHEWRVARAHPGYPAACALLLLGIYALRIAMLHLCFTAFGVSLPGRTALFAYALTQLFATVSLSPTTLGIVDVAYATTLSWLGVAPPVAIAGTVLYRISTFWWPIPLGLFSQWWLARFARRRQGS